MHEGVWSRKNNFWQNDSSENLDKFSLIGLLYMHRWCLHGPINSYHSFWWSNLILCLYNVDISNICMMEFGSKKNNFWQNDSCDNLDNISLLGLLYFYWWCLHEPINFYHSFWWNNFILCLFIKCRHIEQIHEGVWFRKKYFLTKWQLWELRECFPNKAFVYA